MTLDDAFTLFRRLGVDVESLNPRDFTAGYFALAKRYHPDRNPHTNDLMANINAARTTILQCYRKEFLREG
jgi:DnaJ-class molecular chaperone